MTTFVLNFMRILLLVAFAPSCVSGSSATAFLVDHGGPSCHGLFDVTNFTHKCLNTSKCTLGSHIEIAGNLTSAVGFWPTQNLTLKLCPWQADWACYSMYKLEVDLCDALEPLDGQSCPVAGRYTYNMTFNLPGTAGRNLFWGWTIHVEALFTPIHAYLPETECYLTVQAVETDAELLSQAIVGFAVLVSAGAVSIRRKRRVASVPSEETGVEFQRMEEPEAGSLA